MRLRYWLVLLLLCLPSAAFGQLPNWQNFCSVGNVKPKTQGIASSYPFIASYPHCVITVYTHGTTTPLPQLYSDADGLTPLANPFTASDNSWFQFYVAAGRYDVQESDCTPTSCNLTTPFTWPDIQLNVGGGGGGGSPCGVLYDVQINDPLGTFGCDSGIFQENPSTHTVTDTNVNATQQVTVSDATHSGVIIPGHSNGSAVDFTLNMSVGDLAATYGFDFPSTAPTGSLQAIRTSGSAPVTDPDGVSRWHTQWAASGSGVSLEYLYPLDSTNAPSPTQSTDLIRTLFTQQQNTGFYGPLIPTDPASALVQATNPASCVVSPIGPVACSPGSPVTPGNTLYVIDYLQCGIGCSGAVFSYTSALGNTCTQIATSTGSGASIPYITYLCPVTVGGMETITVSATFSGSSYNNQEQIFEIRGAATVDVNAGEQNASAPTLTFGSLTTLSAPDVIIATAFLNAASTSYTQGSGWYLGPLMQGGLSPFASMASEIQQQAGTGTYTPAMTATGSGAGQTISTALHITAIGAAAKPIFRWWRWQDGVAGGDLPDSTGQNGKFLEATSTSGVMTWGSPTGGLTSIQFQNNGTNFGSPMTGTGTMNFVNCTVSGTTPNFTITCTGSAPAFSAITGGTNTTAAMVVGAGASLDYTSTGTIDANKVNGATIPLSATVVGTNASNQVVSATVQGNGTKVQLSTGTTTTNDCVKFDANGNTVDAGAACGGSGPSVICSGTITFNPGAIASNTCSAAVTGTCTGLATTDNIMVDFNADPTATTGYIPGAMLTIVKYPTANTVNVKGCNNTTSSITPTSVTLNFRVVR